MDYNKIIELGEELDQMVQEMNSYDGSYEGLYAYDMYLLDDLFCDMTPSEVLMMSGKNFNIHHDYFRIDGYGHLESLNRLDYYKELIDQKEDIEEDYKEY